MIFSKTGVKAALSKHPRWCWQLEDDYLYVMANSFIFRVPKADAEEIMRSFPKKGYYEGWEHEEMWHKFFELEQVGEDKLRKTPFMYNVPQYKTVITFFFNPQQTDTSKAVIPVQNGWLELFKPDAVLTYWGRKHRDPIVVKDDKGESVAVILPINIDDDIRELIDSYYRKV